MKEEEIKRRKQKIDAKLRYQNHGRPACRRNSAHASSIKLNQNYQTN